MLKSMYMAHYFENDDKEIELKTFAANICGMKFDVYSGGGVFSKNELDYGTELLIESFVHRLRGSENFADLGCGYGIVGMTVLKLFQNIKVSFFDINTKAIELSKKNVGADKRAAFFCQDGMNTENEFDAVAANPPFRAGNQVLFKLFSDAFNALKSGGSFFVVLRKKQGALTYAKKIAEIFGGEGKLLKSKKGYLVHEFCKA